MRVWVIASSANRVCANGRSRDTVNTTVSGGSCGIAFDTAWVWASQTRVSIDGTTDSTTTLPRSEASDVSPSLPSIVSASMTSGASSPTSRVSPTRVSDTSPRWIAPGCSGTAVTRARIASRAGAGWRCR